MPKNSFEYSGTSRNENRFRRERAVAVANFFPDHDVTSVQKEGFGGMENGELLGHLDGNFDVFILSDKNLRYQQNLSDRVISIIELPTNRWPVLMNLQGAIVRAVASSFSGSYLTVDEITKLPGK